MSKTLTAEDFAVQWDAEHYFTFIETEDATIMAFGHVDAEKLLDEVFEYDKLCDAAWAERGEPTDIRHIWAVPSWRDDADFDDDYWYVNWEVDGKPVTEQTPGAIPLTIWMR